MKEEICARFPDLVSRKQLVVREDFFIDALDEYIDYVNVPNPRRLLRDVIMKHGESYPQFSEKVPKQYIKLQEKIGEMRRSGQRIIPYTLLEEVNSALEEPLLAQDLELFVQFEHNCGSILHFNDVHLSHLVVLEPKLVIDVTKSIVTSKRFAEEVWDEEIWNGMVSTGQVDESYILKLWEKNSDEILYQNREFLLLLLQRLDIIAKPKVYDQDGFDAPVRSYYVPCMLQVEARNKEWHKEDTDIAISFRFQELLPPAVVHKVFATCLGLWAVMDNCLYDGWAAFESGPNHILFLEREANSIIISIRHRKSSAKIDINLVRSIQQFFVQTIHRIVSAYGVKVGDDKQNVYKMECNKNAISSGIGSENKVSNCY